MLFGIEFIDDAEYAPLFDYFFENNTGPLTAKIGKYLTLKSMNI